MSDTERKDLLVSKVHLRGFKSINDLTVDLKPGLNILIGMNGSGKTNFLEFLESVIDTIYSKWSDNFKSGEIDFRSTDGSEFKYLIERLKNVKLTPAEEYLRDELYSQKLILDDEIIFDNSDDEPKKSITRLGKRVMLGRNLRTVFNRMGYGHVKGTYIRYDLPFQMAGLDEPGSVLIPYEDVVDWDINLEPSFLYFSFYMLGVAISDKYYDEHLDVTDEEEKKIKDEIYNQIDQAFILNQVVLSQEIIYNLALFSPIKDLRVSDNVSFTKDESSITLDNIRLEFLVNGHWIPWTHLSDGTKRLFHIISEVTEKTRGILLIEEPELGIHPHQFQLLMQFLKAQAEEKQIVISTHSPKALDILNADELDHILIARYDREKGTQINRMTADQQDAAKEYMEDLFLSDYWLLSDLEGDD
ncbi:AAA family ATPase [Pedobacter sp. MC2016-24]|uniref:AAA family ATPase n=1 Tax=Pedobacter sp. MC2016-24 TaxID=2780090 RepID=UPI0018811C60|nr:ATP-binding protein [Pedobacter sp. MC2016-24]MBE9601988.1 AAA family ATPase [Pedobacter sp. MC2016-24]